VKIEELKIGERQLNRPQKMEDAVFHRNRNINFIEVEGDTAYWGSVFDQETAFKPWPGTQRKEDRPVH